MAIRNRVFEDYVALYREAIRTTRYAELPDLQPAPFAGLGRGAAGTAYVLWRLGDTRRAKTWIAAALADRRPAAYDEEISRDERRPSLVFGRPGGLWVRAMIAPAEAVSYARAIARVGLDEYASGAAGHLAAALLVRPGTALVSTIAKLGARILAAVRARAETPWEAGDTTKFAHGWPGLCYAALAHAPGEDWLVEAVARLAVAWGPPEVPEAFQASWCNGSTGSLLLWTKGFAVSGDARFLDAARRTGGHALAASGRSHGLCCGDTGIAFGLLALDRIDPRGGWRGHARVLAAREIAGARFVHSNGLYYGHPGLVCLAQDLLGEPRGFPAVEG